MADYPHWAPGSWTTAWQVGSWGIPATQYTLMADDGSVTVQGMAADLVYAPIAVTVPAGSFFVSSHPRPSLRHVTLTAAPGRFRLTGTPATLRVTRVLVPVDVEFPATASATLTVGRRLLAASGAWSVMGGTASLAIGAAPQSEQKAPRRPRLAAVRVVAPAAMERPSAAIVAPDAIDTAWLALQKQIDEEDALLLLGVLE